MRRTVALTLVALTLPAGLLALGSAGVASTGVAATRSTAHGRRGPATRTWRLSLAPVPDDLALAEIRFPHAAGTRITRHLLHVAMRAPFGSDYLAVATPRAGASSAVTQALVLLVNRPSALEDPVSVKLLLSARGRLGEHAVRRVENPFTRPTSPVPPGLCDTSLHGSTLSGVDLTPLQSAGAALGEFGAAAAVAQAYDVVCGLSYEPAFTQAVTGSSTASPVPGEPPHCTPCDPEPGYACPLAARVSVCVAGVDELARRG
jgi:hypothetical protein